MHQGRGGRRRDGVLTARMRTLIARGLGIVTTLDAEGSPTASPCVALTPWDGDRVVFLDQHGGDALRNIERTPSVEVAVADPRSGRGYRLAGEATVVTRGLFFDVVCRHIRIGAEAIVLVEVRSASKLAVAA